MTTSIPMEGTPAGGVAAYLTVGPEDAGTRLDKWLTEALAELDFDVSRSQVQQWIRAGYVKGRERLKPSNPVIPGDSYQVAVPPPEPIVLVPDDIPLDVVYEDDDVVVVNKPRGLVVHPGAGHLRGTVVNALLARGCPLSPLGGSLRPGVVHRIDKDTSGLVMFAKTDAAYYGLTRQLAAHTVERAYTAVVVGRVGPDTGTIDAPIGRDPHHRQRMAVVAHGKRAVTHFTVRERLPRHTHLDLRLETGRTHQIRVHLAYIGHPLVGDPVYGRPHPAIQGQALHARTLGFVHPRTGAWLRFAAPLPADLQGLLDELGATLLE
ncbi:putative RNA pseudouridine synthase YlyB [Alicyclobacillus cellulosilyticus]|uniref:Pseudouridine synthase n=1 Tax=Alicyclobacillus cellulosilyticus TaxID=1003997 RepID=A0A917K4N9_9BACL|nr:putative RNA pseudouridine synthase YlyB [Alicyclobacillus cellulosilyticus]